MKIADILPPSLILCHIHASSKTEALLEISHFICSKLPYFPLPPQDIFNALIERELLGSTGVGEGVAIPHAKINGLKELVACFGRKLSGLDFDAIDEQPVTLIFILLVPENSTGSHLKALAKISRLLKNQSFRDKLRLVSSEQALYQTFCQEDQNL